MTDRETDRSEAVAALHEGFHDGWTDALTALRPEREEAGLRVVECPHCGEAVWSERERRAALGAVPPQETPAGPLDVAARRIAWLEREVRRLAALVGEAPQPYDPDDFPPAALRGSGAEPERPEDKP